MEFPTDPVAQHHYDELVRRSFGITGTSMLMESMYIHIEHYGDTHSDYETWVGKLKAATYRLKELKTIQLITGGRGG